MCKINVIGLDLDLCEGIFTLELNVYVLCCTVVFFLFFFYIVLPRLKKYLKINKFHYTISSIEITQKFFGAEFKYSITRNYTNIEIANRIYVELITRKAAIPFDENHDVISEVYDSWYTLFNTTREELKKLPGEMLLNNSDSKNLIQ